MQILKEFIGKQTLKDEDIIAEDFEYIYIDKETVIDIKEWFSDPDTNINPTESINLNCT